MTKRDSSKNKRNNWPWPDSLDAKLAAPESHKILLENKYIRAVEVVVKPGMKEPAHTHKLPSIMIIYASANLGYYDENNKMTLIPRGRKIKIEWMKPEGLHAVENLDKESFYRAWRIEFKK